MVASVGCHNSGGSAQDGVGLETGKYHPLHRNLFSSIMAKEDGENMLSLKLLGDNQCKKVLFAEAGKDLVDFLFHVVTLPVGSVIRLLEPNGMEGCVWHLSMKGSFPIQAKHLPCLLVSESLGLFKSH
ncbi:hypothetical protein MLD38_011186 [Melastoma candidum]|uniref:Uncharacterized protein n=1 Tax=Melastoma candidum TaxID=119954 RepID=A0ACB9R296_9MYRT|nr:hypothetical protein MLD38_011186 [Melastoma candidum]